MSYLRELWHAYQTQEVSGGDALLLLTQRPMDATSAPPPGMPAGPQAAPAPATEVPTRTRTLAPRDRSRTAAGPADSAACAVVR